LIKCSDMRRNWTHRCSSSHCPQNCSNSSNPHRSSRHCYSYRRQGRPQGAGTPPDTAPYIPIFIFLKTTTPPNGGNSGGVPPPFLPPAAYAAIGCSKKTDAPMYQPASPAELYKSKQSAPQLSPLLQLPPTRATAVIPAFHQK
jgi:hypothetical protein